MASGGAINVFNLASESIAEGYSLANRFTPGSAYQVFGVRWSRHINAPFPTKLYLYDGTSASTVATWTPAGAEWWQVDTEWWDWDVDAHGGGAVTLTAGHTYYITYYLGAANSWQRYSGANAPMVGVTFVDCRYQLADTPNPSTVASNAHGIDIRVVPWPEPSASGAAPATPTSVDASLASYLSASGGTNTHQTDLPWQTKLAVDAAATNTSAVKTVTDRLNNLSNGAIAWLNDRSNQLTDALNTISAAGVAALNGLASWLGAATKPEGRATIPDQLDSIEANQASAAELAALALQLQWATGMVLWTGAATSQGTHSGNGAEVWQSDYPLHRITITAVPPGQGSKALTNGGTWYPRLGSWAPLLPDGALGERRFLEWSEQWLFPCPRGSVGVAIFAYPGTSWTLEAYSHP